MDADSPLHNYRKHGRRPFAVAVVHGGPGAAGECEAVARELALERGVLEPWQTAATLQGQVHELKKVLAEQAEPPCVLIGHSWGAWLSLLLAAEAPALVRKLILVSSAPFEEIYVPLIDQTRLARLTGEEGEEYRRLLSTIQSKRGIDQDGLLARLGALASKADAYAPVRDRHSKKASAQSAIFAKVWAEAAELRRAGLLMQIARGISCPVTAVHGDSDPHPPAGVREPLLKAVSHFKFVLLKKCGHTPWEERYAREKFFRVLKGELGAE